jgi:UDP-N-acetylmuramate: L-alanyl-gamma-D-glutamyl-meso-diaminopimelate ligase
VPVELRLDPHQVAADVTASGRECYYEPNTDAIIARLKERAKSGDVIIVFSNGGFDGMHEKLLAQL